MTVKEFCDKHQACNEGRQWAYQQVGAEGSMRALWRLDIRRDWRLWIASRPGVMTDRQLRLFACRCVRETPLADGRVVWDLLTDERSRGAVRCTERFARGRATREQLAAAGAAAGDAAREAAWAAAGDAAGEAAGEAAREAAWAAAREAAREAAGDAQMKWLRRMRVNL